MKLSHKVMAIFMTSAMCLGSMVGCSPAADQESDANAGSGTAKYESLEKLDISDYREKKSVSDYISEDLDFSATKEDGTPYKMCWANPDASDETNAYTDRVFKECAGEMGFELVSFDAQSDPQKQCDQINNAVNQGCDVIFINPVDTTSSINAMKSAMSKGVLVIDVQNVVEDEAAYDFYIGPDDVESGQIAASMIVDALPEGGNICLIEGKPGSTAQINRTKGFMGVMQNYPEFRVLDTQGTPTWSTAEAMNIFESDMSKFDKIDAVYTEFDLAALTCIQAAKNVGRDSEIKFVSVDGAQTALDTIAEGGCFLGTAMIDFRLNSELPVKVALATLNGDGEGLDKTMIISNIAIMQDNASDMTSGWG